MNHFVSGFRSSFQILKFKEGDTIRCGIVNEGMNDRAVIMKCAADEVIISLGLRADLKVNSRPNVDLILAIPRPIRLEKLLPIISCIGVGTLVLVGANKVNKDYFGSFYICIICMKYFQVFMSTCKFYQNLQDASTLAILHQCDLD